MWIVAGVLLGLVVAITLIGFHSGPHAHVAAGAVGIVAAVWLAVMAAQGRSTALVWALFAADVAVSAALGVMGWTAVRRSRGLAGRPPVRPLEGAEGVALTDLVPDGIVRVRGEQWSATCVNGRRTAGARVQVIRSGVRLEVWGEDPEELADGEVADGELGDGEVGGVTGRAGGPRKEQGR
jgi:membrane-bound ClpP family serine protease